jgi:hypothetical protein
MAVAGKGTDVADVGVGDAPRATTTRPRPAWPEVAAVWVVGVAVYASTRSSVPALTHDSLNYLLAIEQGGAALYHPHHLAYNAVSAMWLDALDGLGIAGDHLRAVALLDSLLGASSAALVYALLRIRARLPGWLAVAGTAGAGLSFGVWFYSGTIEAYILPLVCLLASLYVLVAPQLSGWHLVAVGAFGGLAVLGHQVHVLFAAVVLVTLVRRGMATRAYLVRYLGALAGVVVTAYGLVLGLVVRPDSPQAAADWFTSYAQDSANWYPPDLATLPAAAFGLGRSLVGGHFMFRIDAVTDRISEAFPDKSLGDETFLVRGLSTAEVAGLVALAAAVAILLGWVAVQGMRRRHELPPAAARFVTPLVTWLAVYSAFFLFWEPWNVEFWIPQATALWLLLAVLSAPAPAAAGERPDGRRPATVLLVAAGLVAVTNLVGSILPASDEGNDVYARQYGDLGEVVGSGDAVVVDRPHLGVGYTHRFTEATAIPASGFAITVDPDHPSLGFSADQALDEVDRVLASGHVVALSPDLVERPASADAADTGTALCRAYSGRWRPTETTSGVTWLVIDPGLPTLPGTASC